MREAIHLEIHSVTELTVGDAIPRIGRVLDAFDDLRPEKAGPRDPPKRLVTSVEEHLTEWLPRIKPGDYYVQLFWRDRTPPESYGTLHVVGDIWNYPPLSPHHFEYGVDEDWIRDPVHADQYADFFGRACVALDAFWGAAGLTSFRRQANDFVQQAKLAGTLVLPGVPGTGWDLREHVIPDVFWLNYVGPTLVRDWGTQPLDGLGVRQEALANGGRVIWSTATPFVFDATADSLTSYEWKRPLYDALGLDTFLHERWTPGRGVRVPSYAAHAGRTAP